MKKRFLILVSVCSAIVAHAQSTNELPAWSAELNIGGGGLIQRASTINFASAYPSAVDAYISNLHLSEGSYMGANLQLGYFVGEKRHFGISTGILYLQQQYSVSMDRFQIEYQSTDFMNQVFRQVLTANAPIQEKITTTNVNIPLLLKYQTKFSKKLGIAIDAGAVFNIQMMSKYNTNAAFDYEAIYDIEQINGKSIAIYDNSPIPNDGDWYLTRQQYDATDKGNAPADFNKLRAQGYNVGLNVKPLHNTGAVSYSGRLVGFMAQPSLSYNIGKNLFLNVGFYYMIQTFMNKASSDYMTTNKVGDYSSLLNGVTKSEQSSYGINLGFRYFLGKPTDKKSITQADISKTGDNAK